MLWRDVRRMYGDSSLARLQRVVWCGMGWDGEGTPLMNCCLHMDSSGNPSGKIHPFGYFWVFLMMPPTKSASR